MWSNEQRKLASKKVKQLALERHISGKNKLLANHALKKILLTSGREYKCESCGVDEWKGKKLSLELEHKDGDCFNNDLNNLEFLCPNCHSITPTYRGRNKNTGKKKVDDQTLLTALLENDNIRQALIEVGLSPRGGNYSRAMKLLTANAGVEKSVNSSDLKSDASA